MPFLLGLIRIIPAIISAFALFFIGAGGMWWWDRRETQVPAFEFKVLFFKLGWKAPKSLGQQLAEMKAREAAYAVRAAKVQKTQQSASAVIQARQERVQTEIRYRTEHTIERVPVYVTAATDARYPVPAGLVRVFDATARGLDPEQVPNAAGQSDDSPSGVPASDLTRAFTGNHGAALSCAAQLTGLQDWVRQMQAASADGR